MKITITIDEHNYMAVSAEVTHEVEEVMNVGAYNAYITKILRMAEPRLMMKESEPESLSL